MNPVRIGGGEAEDTERADTLWRRVAVRDPTADGVFVFGVRTTGIFCRPSCPARRPKRTNVQFFDTAVQAVAAGFRPCRRCDPAGSGLVEQHAAMVERACRRIESAETQPALADLAAEAEMSPGHFQRLFCAHAGVSPKRYGMAIRRARLHRSLQSASSVTDAGFAAGYGSSAAAYRGGRSSLGMVASRYRGGGDGETLRWASAATTLGSIVVAMTDAGLCLIEFAGDFDSGDQTPDAGPSSAALESIVRTRFPNATLVAAGSSDADHIATVVKLIDDPALPVELPLDIRGTAFQQKVWRALQRIPPGRVVSYAELAAEIGQPRAARAVAAACAANTLAVAIPCHRVFRGSGDPAGYRWGVDRKRALIGLERAGDGGES